MTGTGVRGTVRALTVMTAIGDSIREMAGMGVFGVMTMMIGNRITAIVTDARLQSRRRPKGRGAIGMVPMTSALMTGTGVRGTVTIHSALAIGTDARLQSRRRSLGVIA